MLKHIQKLAFWLLIATQTAFGSEVDNILNRFADDAKRYGVYVEDRIGSHALEINIKSLKSVGKNTIGLCQHRAKKIITLDKKFWRNASDLRKETLLYHELGHCVLLRDHTSKRLPTGEYASIMTPYILPEKDYIAHHEYYVMELFDRQSNISTKDFLDFDADTP